MTALTQYLSDLPGREDGEKAGDARPDCERCQLAFVQLGQLDRSARAIVGPGLRWLARAWRFRAGGVDEESLCMGRFLKVSMFPCCRRRGEGDVGLCIVLAAWQARRF